LVLNSKQKSCSIAKLTKSLLSGANNKALYAIYV